MGSFFSVWRAHPQANEYELAVGKWKKKRVKRVKRKNRIEDGMVE